MAKVNREKEMAVPAKFLAKAILSFESYPEFVDGVVSAKRLGGTDTKPRVQFELEIVKRFQYTLEFDIKGDEEIRWHLVGGDFFKVNQGLWRLKPVDANRTKVDYEVEVGFPFFVPGWITKKLTEVNLPKMFESFEGQAKKLMEKGS